MSAVDLGGDDEFYDSGEEDYREPFYESGDSDESGEERHSSGNDEDLGRRGTQPEDYSPLELAQRSRNRPHASNRRERGWVGLESQSPGQEVQNLSAQRTGSGGRVQSNAQDVQSSQVHGHTVPIGRRGLRSNRSHGVGAAEQWQRGGSVATVAGINLFTNRVAGSSRLRPLPEPHATGTLSISHGFLDINCSHSSFVLGATPSTPQCRCFLAFKCLVLVLACSGVLHYCRIGGWSSLLITGEVFVSSW